MPRVIVVGAGIVGASTAWHLARAGASVTLVDAAAAGGVATPNSFSWINSNPSFARPYFELRHRAMSEWRRMAEALPELPVSFSGALYLPRPGLDIEAFAAEHRSWGYRISIVDGARARELEPSLALDVPLAAWAEDEGAAEASDVAAMLASAAQVSGARLLMETKVERLALTDSGVRGVNTSEGLIEADDVVIAAGAATPQLLAGVSFALPFTTPPGLLAHTMPLPPVLRSVLLADSLHIRQKRDGAMVLGWNSEGEGLEDEPESGGRELLRRLALTLRLPAEPILERITTGYRPTPGDGLPVIGRIPGMEGLYAAVMHSGVTLAPAAGMLAAREILEGDRDPLLAPFGPERFAEKEAVAAQ